MEELFNFPVLGVVGEELIYIGEIEIEHKGSDFENLKFNSDLKVNLQTESDLGLIENSQINEVIIPVVLIEEWNSVSYYKFDVIGLHIEDTHVDISCEDFELLVIEENEDVTEKLISVLIPEESL